MTKIDTLLANFLREGKITHMEFAAIKTAMIIMEKESFCNADKIKKEFGWIVFENFLALMEE